MSLIKVRRSNSRTYSPIKETKVFNQHQILKKIRVNGTTSTTLTNQISKEKSIKRDRMLKLSIY
jgi:hypothetical protein